MNVEIARVELRWDSKKNNFVSHRFNVAAHGLLKSQVNSLVRFVYAGMTSNSVGNRGIAKLKSIISEAEKKWLR